MTLFRSIDGFFFRRIPSRGFSLMRIGWALVALIGYIAMWKDVTLFISNRGVLPHDLEYVFLRDEWRFTIFNILNEPNEIFVAYLFFLVSLVFMLLGIWPRLSTIVSVLLMFSFHERNTMILAGGDTLLRNAGFLLMLAPGIGGFSLSRARKQWSNWKQKRSLLPPPTMPIWPWRLLLWQMIVLYITSLWYKFLGTMWLQGTAVEATMHHPAFSRLSNETVNMVLPMIVIGDYFALIWEALWILLLVPPFITRRLPILFQRIALRRILMIGGVFFHGGILLFMDAGIFSLAVFAVYLGLLREDDFEWMKQLASRFWLLASNGREKREARGQVIVLYDGHCGLCLRSVFMLQLFDWLKRIRYVDFRDKAKREKEAPGITEKTLDKAMHIRLPSGAYLTGFDAFRRLSWHLPPLWLLAPFLYAPGIALIGRRIYAAIADRRKKCDHENCGI